LFTLFLLAFILAYLSKTRLKIISIILPRHLLGCFRLFFRLFCHCTGRHTIIYCVHFTAFLTSNCPLPENTSFEIGKTGIIPVSVLTIQYRIGNTSSNSMIHPDSWFVFGERFFMCAKLIYKLFFRQSHCFTFIVLSCHSIIVEWIFARECHISYP
jgi:hypothetical protein